MNMQIVDNALEQMNKAKMQDTFLKLDEALEALEEVGEILKEDLRHVNIIETAKISMKYNKAAAACVHLYKYIKEKYPDAKKALDLKREKEAEKKEED
jgi:hypothetical protein